MIKINRRNFLRVSGASLCAPSLALSNVNQDNTTEIEKEISENIRHNVSSFRALNWKPYFKTLKRGAILVDISSRALHFGHQTNKFIVYFHRQFRCLMT